MQEEERTGKRGGKEDNKKRQKKREKIGANGFPAAKKRAFS